MLRGFLFIYSKLDKSVKIEYFGYVDKMRYQFALPDPQMRYQFKVLYKLKAKCIREIAVIQNGSSLLPPP